MLIIHSIILSRDKQTEIARVTADENGNYRDRAASRRLRSGCPKPQTPARPRDAATVHNSGKSDRARRHGHRHGRSVDFRVDCDSPARAARHERVSGD